MICIVNKSRSFTRGVIAESATSDMYTFELDYMTARWKYIGKQHGPTFISAKDQGYEHIPQEFYAALDAAWNDPNGFHEFPDPLLDDLAVAGS